MKGDASKLASGMQASLENDLYESDELWPLFEPAVGENTCASTEQSRRRRDFKQAAGTTISIRECRWRNVGAIGGNARDVGGVPQSGSQTMLVRLRERGRRRRKLKARRAATRLKGAAGF